MIIIQHLLLLLLVETSNSDLAHEISMLDVSNDEILPVSSQTNSKIL